MILILNGQSLEKLKEYATQRNMTLIEALEDENGVNMPLDELLAHFALFANQDDDSDKNVVRYGKVILEQ